MKRNTIYSVARACGVSSSTVSRAFTRPDLVKASVRKRILETAESMGYQPSRSARAVATGRTAMLGLLVPDITNPFMPPLVRAVQRAASSVHSSILLVDSEEERSAETQLITQLRGQVDGLVLASPRASAAALREATADIPSVLINREVPGLSAVVSDTAQALASLGDTLLNLGHREVALLAGPPASWMATQRRTALRAWAGSAGVRLVELGPFDASFDGGRDAAASFLETGATAAFAFDDVMACGVLAELTSKGVRVPAGRSVVGCDDVLMAKMVTPSLTTVATPVDRLGDVAVELLLERIPAGGKPPALPPTTSRAEPLATPRVVAIAGTPVHRDSIGPPP